LLPFTFAVGAGFVSKGTTTEDSIAVSIFVTDSLGNPSGTQADSFFVSVVGPSGDSIWNAAGDRLETEFDGELDSTDCLLTGWNYIYSAQVSDIDGAGDVGTYELRFCVKDNSPEYITCQEVYFQIVDTSVNKTFARIIEILDSLKAAATIDQLAAAILDSHAARGYTDDLLNMVTNGNFEMDSVVTTTAPAEWTQLAGGDWTCAGIIPSTAPSFGRWRYQFCTGGIDTTILYQTIGRLKAGLYYYGAAMREYLSSGFLFIDSTAVPTEHAWIDSLPVDLSAYYSTGKFVYISDETRTYSIGFCLDGAAPGNAQLDNVKMIPIALINPIVGDTTAGGGGFGAAAFSPAEADSVLQRLIDLQDSVEVVDNLILALRDSLSDAHHDLENMAAYSGSLYDTTGVVLYPLLSKPKDSAQVFEVTNNFVTWTYRHTIFYELTGTPSVSGLNVVDTIIYCR
jgi:hypothetical protein